MISNNTNYKLRATKSSRDVHEYEYDNDENWDDDGGEVSKKGSFLRESRGGKNVGRSRSTEFRPSRISDRRGYRGRGSSSRRSDRDYSEGYYGRKYESRHIEAIVNQRGGKFYEPEKKTEVKLNLPEDTRISKLLRRLNNETDQDASLAVSKKLLEVLLLPDNAHYVRKAFHILGESMYEILHVAPGPLAKQQAARALGRMGYIMGQEKDFERYQHWLFTKMNESYEDIPILLMRSFKETLDLEVKKPVLEHHIDNIINNLVATIETTENAEVFKAILDVLVTVVEMYPSEFQDQFRDTIDLLFGWHVDHTQPLSNIEFVSKSLQRVSHHFKYNLDFSVQLIENFLEDIANFTSQIEESQTESIDHVTVLILALKTVLKCLGDAFHPSNNKNVKVEFIVGAITRILNTVTDALESVLVNNLTIAGNDCISILLGYLDTKPQSLCTAIYKLIDLELSLLDDVADATVISLLALIAKVVKELSANLPTELIVKLIGPKSEVVALRRSPFPDIQEAVICVYQALLNLKNVSLLQEAYRYVLGDLEVAYRRLVPDVSPFTTNNPFLSCDPLPHQDDNPVFTVVFLLRCLSQLANASSIIVMWALKPSILELAGVSMRPYDQRLREEPHVQYCLLYLLFSHCKCYNHFISNSSLVNVKQEVPNILNRFSLIEGLNTNDLPNTSPNSGNFAIILDTLYNTLKAGTSIEVTVLLLQWLKDILINSENYLEALYTNEKFSKLADVLVDCGYNFNPRIVLGVCENLEKLLSNKQLSWSSGFLTNVSDLCKLHMTSTKEDVRNCYSRLLANIPWDITIVELNKVNSVHSLKEKSATEKNNLNYAVYLGQQLHLNGTIESELYPLQFKQLTKYLLNNDPLDMSQMEDIFSSCWLSDSDSLVYSVPYDELASNSSVVLFSWLTLEAAQFCVNYKLRTPLGKPNETFTKIEGALNQLGNELIALKKHGGDGDDNRHETTTARVRLLLYFVENLEKAIYNASEGCVAALPPAHKSVKSFFVANANTCCEWFARIRLVATHVALHSGEPSAALRHGEAMIKDMVATGKTNTAEFDVLCMIVTMALLYLREPESLYGLYSWCKNTVGKRYPWIKHAGEQAAKKYELALEGYKKVLQDKGCMDSDTSSEKKLEPDIQNFIIDQIIVCYKELSNWVELFEWHGKQQGVSENGKKYWFNKTDWECNKILCEMEEDNLAFRDLASWDFRRNNSWSVYESLNTTESNLYNVALKLATKKDQNLIVKTEENILSIQKSIQEFLPLAPSEFLQTYSLLHYVAIGLKQVAYDSAAHTAFLVSESFEKEIQKVDSCVLRKILWWSEHFGKIQNQGFNVFCSNLRLDVIKRARKEKNYRLAASHILKFFKDKDLIVTDQADIGSVVELFVDKVQEVNAWTIDIAKAVAEVIKVSYALTDHATDNTFNLCAVASTSISKYAELFGVKELRQVSTNILLKLASWLQSNEDAPLTDLNSPLGKLIMVLPEIGMVENVAASIIPQNEVAVGKLLHFCVHHCATLAKSWNVFGSWCYRWGKKIVDHSSGINNLSEEHCREIRQLLPVDTPEEDAAKIFRILSQTRSIIDEEDIDPNEIKTSEMILSQLQCVQALKSASEEQLQSLVQIWRNTQKRIYHYYALSADAYFRYLHLVQQPENVSKSSEFNTVTITLRLLRLIVKYALELQTILEEGLQTTPTQPWKVIIPQLFSRLNHPESYVRLRVSDLLCRVAEDAPHLITFPAVVGALEGGLKFDFSEIKLPKDCLSQEIDESNDDIEINDEDEDNNYESDGEESVNTMQSCFKTMVDTLSKQDPETISQVQTLVKELRRISLLWDELWLGSLAQLQSEIRKRQQQLEYEIEKVNENANLKKEEKASLIVEKHRIVIKPIVFILEQLEDVIKVKPETPYEQQFQEKYLGDIQKTIAKLKSPDTPENPQNSLTPLKVLHKKFQQRFQKRTSYSLRMQHISPTLYKMTNTVIVMPGLASSTKKNVTIQQIQNEVSVLPTKTKPKKLVFKGSDGKTYTYLFKGLEDLHLDERIMQFLSIANTMMAQNLDTALYQARHYSVIPLGPRSGLISWVDGTIPLFALYKRWQQRELAKPTPKNTGTAGNAVAAVLRPSELFYNKLNPLLQENGIKNMDNRKEWPLSVLKQVLTELMNETPNDLLAKEFWCNAINPGTWWQVTKRYSYSVAVMSMIGYIIGLGDRHLDNVLVDLTSGDVVHIDYNVCFEKGKTLRVPEKVPFRLTPNIKQALGVTGVEGIFRLASENVLRTMRKGRETLLTLLEAFVYDPLIDWTIGGEVLAGAAFGGGHHATVSGAAATRGNAGGGLKKTKRELEREVTVAMFDVRCTEMRIEWIENRDEIENEIPHVTETLDSYTELMQDISETEGVLQELHQQLALIKEAEAQGPNNHSLYKLPSHHEAYHKSQEAMATAKRDFDEFVVTCEKHIESYTGIVETQQCMQWLNEVSKSAPVEANVRIFDSVKEFLHNAGKDDVVAQCETSEQEVFQLSQHLNLGIRKCLQIYTEYFSILSQCPKSYLQSHRVYLYLQWVRFLLQMKTSQSCDVVFEKLKDFLDSTKMLSSSQLVNVALSLDNLYKENLMQVNKLFEELTSIRTKDVSTSLEKMYSNAKTGIATFLSREKGAASAMEFVIASELVLLNRNLLTLEVAAQRSGDWLIKLTSRDGDWFLDDLLLNSARAVEMIGNLPPRQNYDDKFYKVLNGIKISSNIYQGLYDLNFNFHTIIMPETMKKIQCDEPTVLQMIFDINKLIVDIGMSIGDIILQLEKLLTCVLMQMDVNTTYEYVLERTSFAKKRFQMLIPSQNESLTQGQMLLMGFNGLFDKLNQEINNLVATLGDLEIPKSWKKLDHVKEAKSIAPHIFNNEVRALLEDIFLLKRIKTISEFFVLAQETCGTLKGVGSSMLLTDDQLAKPVKQFIAEFISRNILGIIPENVTYAVCFLLQKLGLDITHEIEQKDIGAESKVPLDDLYTKAWNILLKEGVFSQNVLSQASSLETNLKLAWEKLQEPKKIEQKLTLMQSSTMRLRSQLAVHNVMFDEILTLRNFASIRAKFIVDIQAEVASLQAVYRQLIEALTKQQLLIEKAYQRLNWAKGANPNVGEISAAFEAAVQARNAQLASEQKIANSILSSYATVLHHELLRSSGLDVTKEYDKRFLACFEKWRLACQYMDSKTENLLPAEENILNALTPELAQNPKWLQKISETITDNISVTQGELKVKKERMFIKIDELISLTDNLKSLYNVHCKLMSDVKGLLKTITKVEEYSVAALYYVHQYKLYTEHFVAAIAIFKKEMSFEEVDLLRAHLEYVRAHTGAIYDDLLRLESSEGRRELAERTPFHDLEDKELALAKQDSVNGGKGQQRNAYAVNVWRRVKMKLEGRDPDHGRKCTVQEQVEYVIREASSLDNLALLYEGWTPWV